MPKLLLLEDQPAVRDVMLDIIKDSGPDVQVASAATLGQARERLTKEKWDCMVADLALNDGQSLELIAELRSRGNEIPVILVSGFLSREKLQRARELGVRHVLHKPFHPGALSKIVHDIFGPGEGYPENGQANRPAVDIWSEDILSKVFQMDRRLGLMHRMMREIPRHAEVSVICASALSLAMDMMHAGQGLIALFDRSCKKLFAMSHRCIDTAVPVLECQLDETPFAPLLNGELDYIHASTGEPHNAPDCWPGVSVADYVAAPVHLEGHPAGVICLMDCRDHGASDEQSRQMLGFLVAQLDTLLENCAVHAALEKSMRETLIALVRSLEARDKYTKDHSARVSKISVRLARRLGLDDDTIALVRTGGLLHDIGKGGVPDAVLLKPGRFSDEEYDIIKTHPVIGDNILQHMDTMGAERKIVRHHHERMDGRGYPDHLVGDEIPLPARIVCVADSIDAMTTHRVYRLARPISFCLDQLKRNSGTQFDARVVEVAVAAIEAGEICSQAFPNQEDGGDVAPAVVPASAKL